MIPEKNTVEVEAKAWYASKTLWVNIISFFVFVGGLIIDVSGALELSTETILILGIVLSALNWVLRLVTSQPLASGSGQTAMVKAPLPRTLQADAPPRVEPFRG